jgi:HSP20 family protein
MPWDVRAWQDRLERLSSHSADAWAPAIDVYETPSAYIVTAEVPGVSRDQIELAFDESRLTLRGQRVDRRAADSDVRYHQVERSYGMFARTFEFADAIDAGRATADLSDGVLTIKLPKTAPPPARRIEVT